jgi:hypothetical protein
MILVRGHGGGTALTGTIYEPGESAPSFRGAPEEDAPYVWVCDEFYSVESGGAVQVIDGREVNVAFESPMPRGFDSRTGALAAAEEHVRTQFARVGVPPDEVRVETIVDADADADEDGAEA